MVKVNDSFGYSTGNGQPLTKIFKFPIIKNRAPTSKDVNYRLGQQWINPSTTTAYILSSVSGGNATWIVQGSGGAGAVITITGDSGGALPPTGGNFNILGTANQILVTGVGSTETLSLIGPYTPATYTAHGVLVGEGTSSIVALAVGTDGQVLTGNSAADPSFQAIGSKSGLTAHGVVLAQNASAFTATAAGAVGTVLAGNGAADPTFQAIPALNVVDVTGTTQAMAVNTTYIADHPSALVTFTLPATAAQGTELTIAGNGPGGWQINQNAGQVIKMNGNTTTVGTGGSLSSTNRYNSVTMLATVGGASTVWVINDFSGTFTFV